MQHGIGDFVGDFYQRVAEDRNFRLGRFCWVPIPYVPLRKPLSILDIKDYDPHDETKLTFRIVTTPNAFKDRHVPIKSMNWETDEEIVPLKTKRRPVVIVSCEQYSVTPARTPDNLATYLAAPIYTVDEDQDPAFVARIKCLEYNQFFWLPADSRFNRKEAFVRLDRIQPANTELVETTSCCLSESAWTVFEAWLLFYLTGHLDDDVAEIRAELLKQFYT